MKKTNFLIVLAFLSFLSCTKDDVNDDLSIQEQSRVSLENLKSYKGIPVAHRFEVSLEELGNTSLDGSNAKNKSVRTVDFSNYSVAQIVAAVEMELDKFPYIREESLPEEQIQLLRRDFPTLTEQQIEQEMPIIEEYYHKNLDQLTYARLEKNELPALSKNNDNYGNFNCIKKAFKDYGGTFGSYGLSVYAFYKASTIARSKAPAVFPGDGSNTKQDAYRHILWSSLLCRYYYTISSKAPKLRFAKAVGDMNEVCNPNDIDAREMDYHNNAIGRKVYDQNAPYKKFLGFTVGVRTPSVGNLQNKTKAEVDKAFLIQGNDAPTRAQKIRTKKFNCTTKYIRKSRFICDDNPNGGGLPIELPYIEDDGIEVIKYNEEDCWEYYYEPYQSCSGNVAVILK